MDDAEHCRIVARHLNEHRERLGELHALIVLYRECMEAEGITPPDDSGAYALARFRHVSEINAA